MSKKTYPMRFPRHANGIRAQDLSGCLRCWWGKRWFETLERMDLGGRMGRGRNYALSGQVTDWATTPTGIRAEVMGTRQDPYCVTVDFRAPKGVARRRIVAALRSDPMLIARLLARDLPTELDDIFRRQGCHFFPGGRIQDAPDRQYDMTIRCTCPDYANPCKHAHAVLMLLGEEFVRRPQTLLEQRGITLEELYEN